MHTPHISVLNHMQTIFSSLRPSDDEHSITPGWEIFLSSTVRDLETYRQAVKTALGRAQTACFLSEEWSGGYDDTVQKCYDRLHQAAGYIGIFAFWYGSIPPNSDKSITHMEFQWAMERWGNRTYPPIAVFMPKAGSQAEADLRARAQQLLTQVSAQQQDLADRLKVFHDEVANPTCWRTIREFDGQDALCQYAIIAVSYWRGKTPLNAARDNSARPDLPSDERRVTDDDLVLLGRNSQIDVVKGALSRLGARADIPAAALLVTGDEDAGHGWFLQRLLGLKQFSRGRPPKVGRPMAEPYTLQALIQWLGITLGVVRPGEGINTPEQLAELVGALLQKQQLCFVLNEVNRLTRGVVAFQEAFWQPFYRKLAEIRAQKPHGYPLIAVLVDYTGQTRQWPASMFELCRTAHFNDAKLLLIPQLADFNEDDVLLWLDELDVPDEPPGNRQRVVSIALTTPSGQYDGTPSRVFRRLRNTVLWSEGGNL